MTTIEHGPARRAAGLRVDVLLYLLYGAFAVVLLAGGTGFFTYRVWAGYAVPGYLGAAVVTGVLLLVRKDDPRLRGALVAATAVVVLLLPLASLVVSWSHGVAAAVHPEVVAVERGAARLVAGEFPYLSGEELARRDDSTDYTPYLPLMIAFGLPRALIGPTPFTDPRIVFAAVAVALIATAAALWPSGARSVRWWNVVALSPLTALPFHSGGHDLPVVAATVLGFVLLARGWTVPAAVVMGATMAMKATSAVPLVVAVVLLAATRPAREAVRFAAVAVGAFGAVLLPFLLVDADSLVRNVLLHPAGLENARLLATDPFPGVLLAEWGVLGRTGSVVLLGVVALGLLVWLVRRPPRDVGEAMERSAVCLTAAVLVAPTSRAGYLLYPLVLAMTARYWMGRGADPPALESVPVDAVIWHNPRCSKSRGALALLGERGVDASVVRYLDEAPDRAALEDVLRRLGTDDPRAITRTGEARYRELGLADADRDALLDALAANPVLIERPIVLVGERAVVARPPERVLELLP